MDSKEEKYAGDAAWREWFDICSVNGCQPASAEALRAQIASAMYARLAKCGIGREETHDEDPIAFFDAFFKLKGSRDKGKPLKLYFAYRLQAEGMRLRDFVCGTLFGSSSGRIHDIIMEWIAVLKGWKPRSLRTPDGKRHVVWEGAAPEETAAPELSDESDPTAFLDVDPMRAEVDKALENISRKIKVEKSKVTLLLYAEAQDVPVTNPAVLEELEVGKSRAYKLKEKALDALRRELGSAGGVGSPLFGRILLEACEEALPEATRAKIGAEQ
ncbi:MAG: hypothetical protein IJK04_02330 [Kiritimatiellae bacterium]|nr:hypothetical protein [Kiritimatiellia bacterium]